MRHAQAEQAQGLQQSVSGPELMLHKQSERVWALQQAVLELEQGWVRGSVPPQAPPFVPVQAVQ